MTRGNTSEEAADMIHVVECTECGKRFILGQRCPNGHTSIRDTGEFVKR